MSMKSQLTDAMKDAMRAKDKPRLSAIRLMLAEVKRIEVDERIEVSDERLLSILDKMVKQRRESIGAYESGGRRDLAAREAAEIEIIEEYLPRQMDESEIVNAVHSVIERLGSNRIKDMGRTMAELKTTYPGQMDFSKASNIVKEYLTSIR